MEVCASIVDEESDPLKGLAALYLRAGNNSKNKAWDRGMQTELREMLEK